MKQKEILIILIGLLAMSTFMFQACKKENDSDPDKELSFIIKMDDNALNGDIGQIGAEVELSPGMYTFSIESSTAKFGSNQTAWEGVFIYTHEKLGQNQPSPNLMTSLNGIGNTKVIDLTNYTDNVTIEGFMIPNVPTYDDSGEVNVRIKNNNTNETIYLSVSIVDNALNGDLAQISSEISLPPGKYNFSIESSTAKFGTNQTPWEGAFLYTHEKISDGQPAPNLMTTLNGMGSVKTIDLSNYSNDVMIQGFMVPNVPTYDDSGEVVIKILKVD